ncbi:multidrug effflux MFS transporter [Alkalihalobacillus sp. LMS6]|uniref:multidrug effflux MFS transporter n=1 Tax=Alkalihalobacillus sp. LMS6 TaxID=2924034 RepID=UPI0020D14543|nr:multidrug effflux MFS transporter [Alkalihalobacillus sp. LMS6]UTR05992.1 multidrug effflux MFS transporter [Alkalihalobacillus sp. LMS6]
MTKPFFYTLALLLAYASISTDLYLPALPEMSAALGTTQGALEITVSTYLLGFAVGQLFWGPLSDRYGRKLPLAGGLVFFVIGSVGCAFSTDVWHLIVGRTVQALGASASVVLARAMIRDLFQREEAARVLSTLTAIMIIAPMLGPIIGAQLLSISSWPIIFILLACIGLATLASLPKVIPETLPSSSREQIFLLSTLKHYWLLCTNRLFLSYALACATLNAGIFAFVAGSPFAYISYYNVSPTVYGILFAVNSLGIMAVNMLNRRLIPTYGGDRLLLIGASCATIVGGLLVIITITGYASLFAFALLLFLFVSSSGFIVANSISGGLAAVQTGTGSASALLGFAQYGGGMLGSSLLSLFASGTPLPLAIITFLAGSACLLATLVIVKERKRHVKKAA